MPATRRPTTRAGIAIRTSATHECIRRGKTLVLLTPEEIGLPAPIEQNRIKAAIVEPLFVGGRVEGTLKFYYRDPRKITETQRSIAHASPSLPRHPDWPARGNGRLSASWPPPWS